MLVYGLSGHCTSWILALTRVAITISRVYSKGCCKGLGFLAAEGSCHFGSRAVHHKTKVSTATKTPLRLVMASGHVPFFRAAVVAPARLNQVSWDGFEVYGAETPSTTPPRKVLKSKALIICIRVLQRLRRQG